MSEKPVSGYEPLKRLRYPRNVANGAALTLDGDLRDRIGDLEELGLSRVRLTGGCTIGGERYLYLPGDDALVRESVWLEEVGRG